MTHTESPALVLTATGEPFVQYLETGNGPATRSTRQRYVVENGPVFVTLYGDVVHRVAEVSVNVADHTDVDVILLRQRVRGGDYARRVGTCEALSFLPSEVAARIAAVLAPAPQPARIVTTVEFAETGDVLPAGTYPTSDAWEDIRQNGEVIVDHGGRSWILRAGEFAPAAPPAPVAPVSHRDAVDLAEAAVSEVPTDTREAAIVALRAAGDRLAHLEEIERAAQRLYVAVVTQTGDLPLATSRAAGVLGELLARES